MGSAHSLLRRGFALATIAILTGCGQPSFSIPGLAPLARSGFFSPGGASRRPLVRRRIKHVVIIIQENRSVDNLFQFLPGADTQRWGLNSLGQKVMLRPQLLTSPYDMGHKHSAFLTEYNGGNMNGFDQTPSGCSDDPKCPPKDQRAYVYVRPRSVWPYYLMAETYTFADHMFQTNQGPSFPAHQYFISGTSTIRDGSDFLASENPRTRLGHSTGGCDSPKGSRVTLIDRSGRENRSIFPCFDRNSIMAELDGAGVSWRYYQAAGGAGFWKAVDAIRPIWRGAHYLDEVDHPSALVLGSIANHRLADVVWVTPTGAASDHARETDGSGPSWVASVVNAIGESSYWKSTAIFVVWDDWGGWYDHVKPTIRTSYELGFRIPMIVISPYAKRHHVSHVAYEDGSILKFIETNFGLPSLHTTDEGARDLSDCFNWHQSPTPYTPIPALPPQIFFDNDPTSYAGVPDND